MAAFCEKYHVSPDYYAHRMTIPQIALMSLDSPRVVYPKRKDANDKATNEPSRGIKKKIRGVDDILPLLNKRK